jgi:riboflavin synthase
MFTGLVEDIGRIESRVAAGQGARLHVSTRLKPLVLGESIAVMGVCLTVDAIASDGFEADAAAETLDKSTLGRLAVGRAVHLERALPVGGRFGGHIVAGHVDGQGQLLERRPLGQALTFVFGIEPELAPFIAKKGSIAVDGVSLTVNDVGTDRFHVVLVPHTQRAVVSWAVGDWCNLEVDVLARYVGRWLEAGRSSDSDAGLLAKLAASGYL